VKKNKAWKTNPAFVGNVGKEQIKIHYLDSSVLCLAKKANSIPMFAYYADAHTGIAIEFNFSENEIPCGIVFNSFGTGGVPYGGKVTFGDVDYPLSFPELNYHRLRNTSALVRNLIFTKSQDWAHEQEFRIFRRNVAQSAVAFDRKIISRVIFGYRTTTADVDLVRSWLKNWPSDVVLSKAAAAVDRFDLVVSDFDVVKKI
jgi:hypothetical protein